MNRMYIVCSGLDALRMVERLARGDDCETCPFVDNCERHGCADTVGKLCGITAYEDTANAQDDERKAVEWHAEHEPDGPLH